MPRVLSTDTARTAITTMSSIINGGLADQIKQLDVEGRNLSSPEVWDGQLASQFRSDWPTTSSTLQKVQQDLEALRLQVQQINSDIMAAGGSRGLGSAGSGAGVAPTAARLPLLARRPAPHARGSRLECGRCRRGALVPFARAGRRCAGNAGSDGQRAALGRRPGACDPGHGVCCVGRITIGGDQR